MNPDHERVRNLLTDTVTMLCKNGLQFNSDLRVEGLIGITIDSSDVFLVHLNEKFAAASDNIEHSDSIIEAVRKKNLVHSRVNKSESRSTIEILPEAGGQVDDTHSITDIDSADFVSSDNQEPGVVSEAPASPSKKRRKRRSSKGSRSNTPASDLVQGDQEDTNLSSPGVNIKFEPTNEDDDDDLILVNSELPKPRKTNSLHVNSEANALGLVTLEGLQAQANFSGFEGITGPPPSKRSRNTDPMDPSAGAFVTGIVKNTSGEEVPLDGASWNSIGGDISMSPLLAGGLPTVPGALIDDNSPKNIAAWSGGQRTGASAAQGSSQSDSVLDSFVLPDNNVYCNKSPDQSPWLLHDSAYGEESKESMISPIMRGLLRRTGTGRRTKNLGNLKCRVPDCNAGFYYSWHLKRHEAKKHGIVHKNLFG